MDTLIFTQTPDGVTIRDGTKRITYDIKEELKMLGAKWHPGHSAWIFRGVQEIPMVKGLVGPCEAALVRLENARKQENIAAKAHRAWLKTDEGRAATEINKRQRISAAVAAGCTWICCDKCDVIDWVRRFTDCAAHAVDGNSFRVNGNIRTGD